LACDFLLVGKSVFTGLTRKFGAHRLDTRAVQAKPAFIRKEPAGQTESENPARAEITAPQSAPLVLS
jgi:hypothetical protein